MEWITDRNPKKIGLYMVLLNENRWDPSIFTFAFWNGTDWKLSSHIYLKLCSYRPIKSWYEPENRTGLDEMD